MCTVVFCNVLHWSVIYRQCWSFIPERAEIIASDFFLFDFFFQKAQAFLASFKHEFLHLVKTRQLLSCSNFVNLNSFNCHMNDTIFISGLF